MSTLNMKLSLAAVAVGVAASVSASSLAQERYLGDILWVGFNFCPRGTAAADGAILPINQNQALFSLYGTTYGGDGRTTFALPDLRGRMPLSVGQGPGLPSYNQGQRSGSETTTLTTANMPPHDHGLTATSEDGNSADPLNRVIADGGRSRLYVTSTPGDAMDARSIGATGGNTSVNNMQPYLTVRACVVLQGLFPSRN